LCLIKNQSCLCGCIFLLTNSPLIGPLSHACSLSKSGLGPSRAEVGFGSRLVGCVRRFRPPPSSGWCLARRPSAFSFPWPLSGFARSGLGVLVLVFFLFPDLFCVPRLVSRLSNLSSHSSSTHLHFPFISTFISFVGASKALLLRGASVSNISIDVKLVP
jgi:hypothetical protein